MKKNSIMNFKKVIIICLALITILGISTLAGNTKIYNIKIKFPNDYEFTVITSKTKVSEILAESKIILEDNESVTPGLDETITDNSEIIITAKGEEPLKKSEQNAQIVDTETILDTYTDLTEKIVTEIIEIPFETITKDISSGTELTTNKILQYGKVGQRKVVYKITYKGETEIKREELSSEIISEPVNKIVQVQSSAITARSSYTRVTGTSGQSGVYKITAYCSCAICCGKTNGITASGVKATSNRTIAAPSTFKFGTKVIINGQEYTVEDRGGAIQGNRIDIYMDSHSAALAWGVKYLEVEVEN